MTSTYQPKLPQVVKNSFRCISRTTEEILKIFFNFEVNQALQHMFKPD